MGPRRPDSAHVFSSPEAIATEAIAEYITYLFGGSKKNAPFYLKQWDDVQKNMGRLQRDLIIDIFAYQLNDLQAVAPPERTADYSCVASGARMRAVWPCPPKKIAVILHISGRVRMYSTWLTLSGRRGPIMCRLN
ncbi:hypothetical protein BD414DRAFT_319244 [Trametes punicea]|nr:hypothetical protein BD414DRAFT_319244 [Trametes punicea]